LVRGGGGERARKVIQKKVGGIFSRGGTEYILRPERLTRKIRPRFPHRRETKKNGVAHRPASYRTSSKKRENEV